MNEIKDTKLPPGVTRVKLDITPDSPKPSEPTYSRVPLDPDISPIISRRKITLDDNLPETLPDAQSSSPEHPSISEITLMESQLPPEYQSVLDKIRPDAPEAWKLQARQAAYYFWSLDKNIPIFDQHHQSLGEQRDRMAKQIAETGVAEAYYSPAFASSIDINKALPSWITTRHEQVDTTKLAETDIDAFCTAFEKYGDQRGQKLADLSGQPRYRFDQGIVPGTVFSLEPTPLNHKLYIENSALKNPQAVMDVLADLAAANIHPNMEKLFEDERLALYWFTTLTPDQKKQIDTIFSSRQVRFRGPAQDPVEIHLQPDGTIIQSLRYSNDATLVGNSPFVDNITRTYSSEKFFQRYLQMCFFACKDPTQVYDISFVPIFTNEVADQTIADTAANKASIEVALQFHLPTFKSKQLFLDLIPDKK